MNGDTQNITPQQENHGHQTENNAESIAAHDDFKPYLESVIRGATRTRSIIYVLVAALLLVFTAYRTTTSPDWTDLRLARLQQASVCYENNLLSDECKQSIEYAVGFVFQGSSTKEVQDLLLKQEFRPQLREQINALIRQRTDGLTLRLPFFGLTIDMNDLGMMGGFLLTAILYILYASLKGETENIKIAKRKARSRNDQTKRADNLELLLMAQVLASPAKSIGVGQGLYLLFVLVPLLHVFVLYSDLTTYPKAVVLQGQTWALIETGINVIAFCLVVICSVLCLREQRRLNQTLDELG